MRISVVTDISFSFDSMNWFIGMTHGSHQMSNIDGKSGDVIVKNV